MKLSKTMERWSPLVVLAFVLVVWQIAVWVLNVPDFIFPGPVEIARQFAQFSGPLMEDLVENRATLLLEHQVQAHARAQDVLVDGLVDEVDRPASQRLGLALRVVAGRHVDHRDL